MKSKKSTSLGQYTGQLTFWETIAESKYSHTIELYTAIPQRSYKRIKRRESKDEKTGKVVGKYIPKIKRRFEHRGVGYKITITPARLDRAGIGPEEAAIVETDYYPGEREDLVETVMIKKMCDRQGGYIDGEAATHYSRYQIRKELERTGHAYSDSEIEDALNILHKTTVEIESDDKKFKLSYHPIEMLGAITLADGTERTGVIWNSLVTTSIKNGTYRLINYEKLVSWKKVISREMHRRLSHNYTQASIRNKFEILLSTMIRDFGLTACAQLRDNLRAVEAALVEMKDQEVLIHYEIHKIFDGKRKNKMVDAKITLITHPDFNSEVIEANRRHSEIQKQLKPVSESGGQKRP